MKNSKRVLKSKNVLEKANILMQKRAGIISESRAKILLKEVSEDDDWEYNYQDEAEADRKANLDDEIDDEDRFMHNEALEASSGHAALAFVSEYGWDEHGPEFKELYKRITDIAYELFPIEGKGKNYGRRW
jgi:hypothetical protein